MDDIKIMIQSTPNPNALKFILNRPVKTEGKISYRNVNECGGNPLAEKLFTVPHVTELHFFENVITVSQDGRGDWDPIEESVKSIIQENIARHNPNFEVKEEKAKPALTGDLMKIDTILDNTVRPYLQSDGGDLQIIALEGNRLIVNYQGACGSCPSSTAGTLKAIENILREEFNPDIEVVPAQSQPF